jgi:hypothetical protein
MIAERHPLSVSGMQVERSDPWPLQESGGRALSLPGPAAASA